MQQIPALQSQPRRYWAILGLLFGAGFSGLVYEVVWARILTLTFGGTVFATSAVLCAFMGGMALGSWVAGKWVDRHRSPLLLLATVQFALGALGLGLMPIFSGLTHFYVFTYRALHPGFYTLTGIRFVFSVLILLVPAALIAAVFPIIIKLAVSAHSRIGRGVALVYGIDTMGGVLGVATAGFILLPLVGVTATVRIAASLNLVVGLLALLIYRGTEAARAQRVSTELEGASPASSQPALSPRATRVLLGAFAVSGAAALSYEVLVTKVMVHFLKMNIYAVSTMLICFLFGLGLGSLLCVHLLRRPRPLLFWFALTEAGIGLIGFSLPLQFAWLPTLMHSLASGAPTDPAIAWLKLPAACFAVLLAPTLLMGATLPLLAPVLTPNLRQLGRSVGTLYSVNTLGAVGGVLLTTFLVVPFVGFKTGMIMAGCLNLLVAAVALYYSYDIRPSRRWGTALVLIIVGAPLLIVSAHSPLQPVVLSETMRGHGEAEIQFFKEGATGTVAVYRARNRREGYYHRLAVSGASEGGSDIASLRSFQLVGNLPFFLHQDQSRPKRVLVLAIGMGITLGAAVDQDSESVSCVELVPEVLEVAPFFAEYNHNALANRKVKVYIEDARNFLLATEEKFDIVLLDATHPANGDSWMLYTQECYQLVKRVLAPGGVMGQWVPLNDLEVTHYLSILKTIQSVFPHITLWSMPDPGNTAVVATLESTRIDFAHLRRRMADPAVYRNFQAAQIPDEYTLLSYFIAGEEALANCAQQAPINTDDLAPVQFTRCSVVECPNSHKYLHRLLTQIKESPLPLLDNLGATPEEAAASAERIERTHKASVLLREGIALLPSRSAFAAFQAAYRLNPDDGDTAVILGLPRPPSRPGADLSSDADR